MNSKSAEILRSFWQEVGATHTRKKDYPYAKENFDFTLASTVAVNRRSFTRPLAANTCANYVLLPDTKQCLPLATRYRRRSIIKDPQFRLINHRRRLVYFNTLSGRHDHLIQKEMVVEPRNKVEIWMVSWALSFLPSDIPLLLSQIIRRRRIKMR